MKQLLILAVLIITSGCTTPHTRIVYSEADGVLSFITGKTKSCVVYMGNDSLSIDSLVFDAGEDSGTCKGIISAVE